MKDDLLHALLLQAVSPDATFAPSPIDGTGSFAARKIKRGELIVIPENQKIDTFYLNHCFTPNSVRARERLGLIAARDIRKGEEITEHYGFLPLFDQEIPEMPFPVAELGWPEYWAMLRGMPIR